MRQQLDFSAPLFSNSDKLHARAIRTDHNIFQWGNGVPTARGYLPILLLLAAIGCSNGNPRTYEVKGFVRFPDGNPLTSGTIEFEALDHDMPIMATSEIDSSGAFELGTFDVDDGAIEGRHRVVVVSSHKIGTGAERPGLIEPSKLHPRFSDFKTSGLEFEVKPGKNEITIPVEYAPTDRRSRS